MSLTPRSDYQDRLAATQVAHPWKATLRTFIAVGIPTILGLLVVLPEVIQIVLDELGEAMPDGLRLWLAAAAGVIIALSTAATRIMAIPAVNAWLTKLGLGATPKV